MVFMEMAKFSKWQERSSTAREAEYSRAVSYIREVNNGKETEK
jgi:hypothetical protein